MRLGFRPGRTNIYELVRSLALYILSFVLRKPRNTPMRKVFGSLILASVVCAQTSAFALEINIPATASNYKLDVETTEDVTIIINSDMILDGKTQDRRRRFYSGCF